MSVAAISGLLSGMRNVDEYKYARTEWERRFLLDRLPEHANIIRVRHIIDRYINGTTLRLRQEADAELTVFKLTQKLRAVSTGARQGLITTMYLTEDEFRILEKLPAQVLKKTRYSVPPFGIDVFEDTLAGLVIAEAEFNSAEEASQWPLPPFILHEVTDDARFTGGELVRTSRKELVRLLAEYKLVI